MSCLLGPIISKLFIYRVIIMPKGIINIFKLVFRVLKPKVLIKLVKVLY